MRNVLILGSGGLAAELTFYIEDNNSKIDATEQINIIGYIDYDDAVDKFWKKYNFKAPVVCDIDGFEPTADEEVLIGVANLKVRNEMIDKLIAKKAKIGSFVHHSVIMPKSFDWGIGNILFPFCIIEQNAVVGNYNLLTSYSFISHDCFVGDNNFFSISGLAGNVRIGNNNFFGIRSCVIPGIRIGSDNVIQAGMVIDKDIEDDTTIFYRFKERVLAIPKQN